jgi:protoheme IX farnesyltransferase
MQTGVEAVSRTRDAWSVLRGLVQLTKPSITRMVLITTLAGAVIAPGRVVLSTLLAVLFGTASVVAAANALNMYLERDVDPRMERTKNRPLCVGLISPEVALVFAIALSTLGLMVLALNVNLAATLLCMVAFLSYVVVYTPLKRVTPYALHVGAVPGAIPPVIGWAAVTGDVSFGALTLFLLLFVWQLPHFLAIAIFREREYADAGLKVYTAVRGVPAAKRAIIGYSLLLVGVSYLPLVAGLGGITYGVIATLLGIAQLAFAWLAFTKADSKLWARRLFFASLPYLVVVFACLAFTAG